MGRQFSSAASSIPLAEKGPGVNTSLADVKEIFKTNYTIEFDQGLTEE